MRIPYTTRVLVILFFCLAPVRAQATCSYSATSGKFYDLSPLVRTGVLAADWEVNTNAGTIYFNFCAATRQECSFPNQAVCDYTGVFVTSSLSYGTASNYTFSAVSGTTDGIRLIYPTSPSACSRGGYLSSQINVYCNRLEEGRVSAVNMVGCVLSIDFQSVHGCSSTVTYPSPSPMPSPTPRPIISPLPPSTPDYTVVQGMDQVGHGYNAFASSDSEASLPFPIFSGYTYYHESTWNSTQLFSVPDQIHIVRGQNFGIKSNVYRTVGALISEESWSSGAEVGFVVPTDIIDIPVRIGANLTEINAEMEASQGVLAIAKERIPLYTLRLYPQQTYDPYFVSAVNGLPSAWDPSNQAAVSKFKAFFADYGTHLQIGVDMGGEFGVYDVYGQDIRKSYSDVDLAINIKVSFLHKKVTVNDQPYAGINKVPQYNTVNIINKSKYWTFGGIPPLSSQVQYGTQYPWYKSWVQSVNMVPAPIGRQLQSIYIPMATINRPIADAYMEYLSSLLVQESINSYEAPPQTVVLLPLPGEWSNNYPVRSVYTFTDECLNQIWANSGNSQSEYGATTAKVSPLDWVLSQSIGTTPGYPTSLKHAEIKEPVIEFTMEQTPTSNCGTLPCLPGLDVIGSGIDGTTGENRLPIFDWTFDQRSTFYNSYSQTTYAVPDQCLIQTSYDSPQPKSYTFYSVQQILEFESKNMTVGDNIPLFTRSKETSDLHLYFDKSISVLGLAEEHYDYYSITVNDQFHPISKAFNYSIEALPSTYVEQDYMDFILFWGTHVITASTFGGKARVWASVDQNTYLSSTESSINQKMGLQFGDWSAGFQYGTQSSQSSYQFSQHSFQWVTFFGGNATLALTNQWQAWKHSTLYYPAALSKTLQPIQNFISDPVKAGFVEQAVISYFSKGNNPPLPPPVYPGAVINYSEPQYGLLYNNSLLYAFPDSYCEYKHGFLDIYYEYLVSSVSYINVTWSPTPPNYAPLPPIQTGNCGHASTAGNYLHTLTCAYHSTSRSSCDGLDGCNKFPLCGAQFTYCQLVY